jgi:hypothetical protein
MQITADFGELCRTVCPLCAKDADMRYRPETQEYVHDVITGTTVLHSICWATGLRKKYQEKSRG